MQSPVLGEVFRMARKGTNCKRKFPFKTTDKILTTDCDVPWVEKFAPETLDDLAVHKKKLAEVETWFRDFFSQDESSKKAPVLLLTGPPGAGKTTTIKTISKKLDAELFIWSNSKQENSKAVTFNELMIQKDAWNNNNESQALVFSNFLLRCTKYSLFSSKRIILVEEFPNALVRDPSTFHNIIKKYVTNAKYPVVFIISDNVKGESIENSLFPKDFQVSLKLSNISFNPVAPTMMMKVLNRISANLKVGAGYPKLNKSDLEAIVADSMGDIRNAINSLQFFCISGSIKPKSLHAKTKNSGQDPLESQEHCLKRDSSLFLFHALGKILYCKRDPSLKSEKDILPGHMKCLERDPLLANVEEVYQKTSISAEGFTLFLQENYIDFTEDINVASDCSQWLSEADVISNDWNNREAMNEYLVSLSARGLMFCIKSCNTGKRWRPLHKPQVYDNVKKINHTMTTLKNVFKEKSLTMRELQVDLVPFIPKLEGDIFTCEKVKFAKELGDMNVRKATRPVIKPLDEKDCFQMDEIDSNLESTNNIEHDEENLPDLVPPQLSDEEIVIEEYNF